MGVVNVTPDSFSDGGRCLDPELAVKHGRRAASPRAPTSSTSAASRPAPGPTPAAGRGGARPGAPGDRRRWPPTASLVSVDTMRAEVAAAAVAAGAVLVNDVSGGLADHADAAGRGRLGAPYVADALAGALARRCSSTRRTTTWSADVRRRAARQQLDAAVAAGIDPEPDRASTRASASPRPPTRTGTCSPARERLHALGHPVLVATSRKWFLGSLLADAPATLRPPELREDATTATSALAAAAGAWCVRVHAARPPLDAVRVAARWAAEPAAMAEPRQVPRARGRGGERRVLRGVRDRRPRRDAGPVARRPRDALRAPGGAAGAGHRADQPLVGADHGEHAVHPVLPHRRRGQPARDAAASRR